MQHVFHKSGYNYIKRRDHTEMSRMFTGPGIISAQGGYSVSLLGPRILFESQAKCINATGRL